MSRAGKLLVVAVLIGTSGLSASQSNQRDGAIWHVSTGDGGQETGTSWAASFHDIQSALAVAISGDQIWVAEGAYTPSDTRDDPTASFGVKDGVAVLGGFTGNETAEWERDPHSHPTILSGDLLGNDDGSAGSIADNSLHVVECKQATSTTVLDGFTIQGGRGGHWSSDPRLGAIGGGVVLEQASPTIRNCTLVANTAFNGGGIAAVQSSAPTLVGCLFFGNTAIQGGGVFLDHSSATISECRIENNGQPSGVLGSGGGMFSGNGSSLTVTDTTFVDNEGGSGSGAIVLLNGIVNKILRCKFVGNIGGGSGAIGASGSDIASNVTLLQDCAFSGNVGTINLPATSGAVTCGQGTWTVDRCSFVGNVSPDVGAAINGAFGFVSVSNCIVWNNHADGKASTESQLTSSFGFFPINYCCVEAMPGGAEGVGNIFTDPLFLDLAGSDGLPGTMDDDLALGDKSPCLDAASPDEMQGIDLSGAPRWIDGDLDGHLRLDMGCMEYSHVQLTLDRPSPTANGALNIELAATGPLDCQLVLGFRPGEKLVVPFGAFLMNMNAGFKRIDLGLVTGSLSLKLPKAPQLPESIRIQCLAWDPATGVGNVSNVVVVALN